MAVRSHSPDAKCIIWLFFHGCSYSLILVYADIFTILITCYKWIYLWNAFGVNLGFPSCARGIRLHHVYSIHLKCIHSFKVVEVVCDHPRGYHPSRVCLFIYSSSKVTRYSLVPNYHFLLIWSCMFPFGFIIASPINMFPTA